MTSVFDNRWVLVGVLLTSPLFFTLKSSMAGAEDLTALCERSFAEKGECPPNVCSVDCVLYVGQDKCQESCLPKPCVEISAEDCPLDDCQVLEGCQQKKVCYYQIDREPPSCGDLAYFGQDVECCPGLIKRCGIEFLDGRCDMVGEYTVYSVPICIPCGDGICSQFENKCNCPEDCG